MKKTLFVRISLRIYGTLGVLGVLGILFLLHRPETLITDTSLSLRALAIGLAAAIPVEICSIFLFRYSPRTRELSRELHEILGAVSTRDIALIALASGIGEELIFRGFLQPLLSIQLGTLTGLLLASLIFGILHIHQRARLAGWMFFAGVMGIYLGGLYLWTGTVLAPAVTHVVVNFINLHAVAKIPPVCSWFQGKAMTDQ